MLRCNALTAAAKAGSVDFIGPARGREDACHFLDDKGQLDVGLSEHEA